MATISSLGIGSGLDLSSIVSGLVEAERAPTESRLDFKEENLTTELSAFGLLRSSLSVFQGSLSSLKSATSFNTKSFTASDTSVFNTSVENYADIGNYSVEVSTLASTQTLASNAATAFSDVNDTIGTGTMTVRFGTTVTGPYSFTADTSKATQTIIVSAANGNTTVAGLRDYINENDFGIQASIVDDGNGYRLVLTSENSGAANSMEITVSGDADGNNNDNSGLSQLAYNASAQLSLTQTVAAADAELSVNGIDITRDNNTISGVINGVTLDLKKADIGNVINLSIQEDIGAAQSAIEEFVANYNEVISTISTLTRYDVESDSAGILLGDFTIRSISGQMRNLLTSSASQLTGDIRSLAEIGIKTTQDGSLELDSSVLTDALNSNADEVAALFALAGNPSDSNISYQSATSATVAGTYAINIDTLATQGVFNGTTIGSLTIDANNDNFTITVDGITSNSISLAQGTYASGADLASHIQAQINDDALIKAAGSSVTVSYDSINNEFDITSIKYGSSSSIEFTSIDTNTLADLGFSVSTGITGVDVSGTINGRAATGSGQLLTSISGDSTGLVLTISGTTTGDRGSVVFSRGIADLLDSVLDNFLDTDGLISSRVDGINEKLGDISDERDKLDLRVSSLEARLIAQFSALDSLIAQFNNTSTFLTQQLANLPKPNSTGKNN